VNKSLSYKDLRAGSLILSIFDPLIVKVESTVNALFVKVTPTG